MLWSLKHWTGHAGTPHVQPPQHSTLLRLVYQKTRLYDKPMEGFSGIIKAQGYAYKTQIIQGVWWLLFWGRPPGEPKFNGVFSKSMVDKTVWSASWRSKSPMWWTSNGPGMCGHGKTVSIRSPAFLFLWDEVKRWRSWPIGRPQCNGGTFHKTQRPQCEGIWTLTAASSDRGTGVLYTWWRVQCQVSQRVPATKMMCWISPRTYW